ncbi:hypothetical protein GOBAR_DD22083 [Gossypium barbadense]|nr:hypothetical protein GOBAR_DD22083 [Gossypium barbadense]
MSAVFLCGTLGVKLSLVAKRLIEVYFFGFHIHQETHDLCEETSCPVTVGNFVLSHNEVLPGFTPPLKKPPIVCNAS